jgi:cytoskeletal protein RodZ
VADGKSETSGRAGAQTPSSLGAFLTAARKEGGYTAEQVAAGTHIPPHYIKAIETDDYGMISDQLYLLPFLRRYAAFIGLDPEDVASRFVREVQRAEVTAAKVSEPIAMISNERKPGRARYVGMIVFVLGAAGLVAAVLVNREILIQRILHFAHRSAPGAALSPSAEVSPAEEPTPAPAASESEALPSVAPTPAPPEPTVVPTPAPRPRRAAPPPPSSAVNDNNIE